MSTHLKEPHKGQRLRNFTSKELREWKSVKGALLLLLLLLFLQITSLKVDAIIRGGLRRFTDMIGQLWCSLADYYIRSGHFDRVSLVVVTDRVSLVVVTDRVSLVQVTNRVSLVVVTDRVSLVVVRDGVSLVVVADRVLTPPTPSPFSDSSHILLLF